MFLQRFMEFLNTAAPVACKNAVFQTIRCQYYTLLKKEDKDFINKPTCRNSGTAKCRFLKGNKQKTTSVSQIFIIIIWSSKNSD